MKASAKEWIQYGSAVAMIGSGIALVFLSFALTLTIGSGVLAYIGEAFGAALGIFGVANYFKMQAEEFKTEIRKELKKGQEEEEV